MNKKEPTLKEQGFYATTVWRRARRLALQRDNYLCQECRRNGRTKLAHSVHHIKPLETNRELSLTLDNLESLCFDCHEATKDRHKTAKELPSGVRIIKMT